MEVNFKSQETSLGQVTNKVNIYSNSDIHPSKYAVKSGESGQTSLRSVEVNYYRCTARHTLFTCTHCVSPVNIHVEVVSRNEGINCWLGRGHMGGWM